MTVMFRKPHLEVRDLNDTPDHGVSAAVSAKKRTTGRLDAKHYPSGYIIPKA
jgi:hypothetical protein